MKDYQVYEKAHVIGDTLLIGKKNTQNMSEVFSLSDGSSKDFPYLINICYYF